MKKLYLLLISLLLLSNISFAQCGIYTEVISQNIEKIRFWDDMNGFAIGGAKLMITNDGGETWRDFQLPDYETLLDYPLFSTQIIDETSAIIVGYNGHILFTNDKGLNWNYQSLRYDGRESLSTVSFVNDKIGYIGGFNFDETELIIFKTIDAGLNWKKIPTSLTIYKLEYAQDEPMIFNLHFVDESIGFLWKRNKLFKTIDSGINWLQQPTFPQSLDNNESIVNIKNGPNNNLYLSTNSSQGIQVYKTTNIGESWNIVNELEISVNSLTNGNFDVKNNFLYAEVATDIGYKKELLRLDLTTNQVSRTPLKDDLGSISDIYFYEDSKGVLVASHLYGTTGRIILKTEDSGNSYSTLDSFNVKSNNVANLKILPNENNVFTAAVIDQYDNSTDYNNSALYLHISKDNGNSWKQIVKTEKQLGALLYAKNSKIVYYTYEVLSDFNIAITVLESDDYGNSWQETQTLLPYIINVVSPNIIAIDENTFLYADYFSTDKGQTWTNLQIPVLENTSFYTTKYKSLNEIYIWGYSQSNGFIVYKSQNQGQSWTNTVTIPGSNGSSVAFGSDFVLVHNGYDEYFKVNLANNSYEAIPFINPLNQSYINVSDISFITDTYWLISEYYYFYNVLHSSQDQGQTWTTKICHICSNNFIYNEFKDELISYSSQNFIIGRLTPYLPQAPIIFGNTMTQINSIEEYFIPIDVYASSTWELISGGEIISDDNTDYYKIKVKWNQSGENILRVRRTNSCGESEYATIIVSVLPENSNEILDSATAFPNPFTDKISVQFRQQFKSYRAEIYNLLGVKVVGANTTIESNKVVLENLGHLSTGVYFIKVSDNDSDKYQMIKVIKE